MSGISGNSTPLLRTVPYLLLLAPVFVILAVWGLRRNGPLHIDEVYWIGQSYYYNLAFIERDWNNPDWRLLPAREHPPVGKYMIGLALNLNGRRISSPDLLGSFLLLFSNTPKAWGSGPAYEKRLAVAKRVDPLVAKRVLEERILPIEMADVRIGRILVMLFAILTALVLYVTAWICVGWRTGLLASVLFALHPAVINSYSWVLIDIVPLAFSCLAVLCLVCVAQRRWLGSFRPGGTAAGLAILLGAFLGLACGAKMNALIVAGLAGLATLWFAYRAFRSRARDAITAALVTAIAMIVALCVFIADNPALYPDIWGGLKALVAENHCTAGIQEDFLGGGLHTVTGRFLAIGRLTGNWFWLFLVVVACFIYQAARSVREASAWMLICAWWLVALVLLLAWLPFAWDRYVLPLIPPSALLVARTIDELGGRLLQAARGDLVPESRP
jgi:hypothetical protein